MLNTPCHHISWFLISIFPAIIFCSRLPQLQQAYLWLRAVNAAVEEMNNNPDLLPNSTLGYLAADTSRVESTTLSAAIAFCNWTGSPFGKDRGWICACVPSYSWWLQRFNPQCCGKCPWAVWYADNCCVVNMVIMHACVTVCMLVLRQLSLMCDKSIWLQLHLVCKLSWVSSYCCWFCLIPGPIFGWRHSFWGWFWSGPGPYSSQVFGLFGERRKITFIFGLIQLYSWSLNNFSDLLSSANHQACLISQS